MLFCEGLLCLVSVSADANIIKIRINVWKLDDDDKIQIYRVCCKQHALKTVESISTMDETTNKSTWLSINLKPTSELDIGRIKIFLHEKLYHALTKHNLEECFKVLRLLSKETYLDPYILFRLVMILIESNPQEKVSKNVTIYLETLLNKLNLCKPEIFVEFLAYFIKHGRLEDAREMFAQRQRYITFPFHRPLPPVIINLNCYDFLLHYLEWRESDDDSFIDISTQGWLVNQIENLRNIKGNYEFFVKCLLEVLLYYGYSKKAYLFMSEFIRNNPLNLGAQLLMYKLLRYLSYDPIEELKDDELNRLEAKRQKDLKKINNFSPRKEAFLGSRYPITEDRHLIIKNIKSLDPTRDEFVKLTRCIEDPVQRLQLMLDSMEYLQEFTNIRRWKKLKKCLDEILSNESALQERASEIWNTKYRRYWQVDFAKLITTDRELIEEVMIILNVTLQRNHTTCLQL